MAKKVKESSAETAFVTVRNGSNMRLELVQPDGTIVAIRPGSSDKVVAGTIIPKITGVSVR